jgi:hypothetical protein
MEFRRERQLNPVADEVAALIAVVRPILLGILNSLKKDVVAEVGGRDNVRLRMLPRLYRRGDGDCGICFEYAVHDALNRGDGRVVERVADALQLCNVPGLAAPTSILFGAEKCGVLHLIDNARATLTQNSRLLKGGAGRPINIGRYLDTLQEAFGNPDARQGLPSTINGLWKADLIIGRTDEDKWVAATVKINAAQLEAASGIRIGIVPSSRRHGDKVRMERGLVVCPLPHDGAFMQKFYEAWRIVRAFIDADAQVPKEAALPRPEEWEVARVLAERREFPVREVVEVLASFGQPDLLIPEEREVVSVCVESRSLWSRLFSRQREPQVPTTVLMPAMTTQAVFAPMPLSLS